MSSHITKRNVPANHLETAAWKKNRFIIGIDEAGRGCLAGPVVAGAVALFYEHNSPLIQDSKTLTPTQRATAYQWIIKHAYYATGQASAQEIDSTNILIATKIAMQRALEVILQKITDPVEIVLIDAVRLPESYGLAQQSFYFGEQVSVSIAAASIIAKETRDRLMEQLATTFSSFTFAQHKGYGTKKHLEELAKYGPSPIHRTTFAPIRNRNEDKQSQILW